MHMSKCFQAIEKLKLDNDSPPAGVRPKALGMESCVGVEYLAWKTPLPLNGKVRWSEVASRMTSSLALTFLEFRCDLDPNPTILCSGRGVHERHHLQDAQ
jgi:hypothetical protein